MLRPTLISVLLCLSLAGCNPGTEEDKRNAHRPNDGIAAFVEGCILPNGSDEHARTAYARHDVTYGIAINRFGHFPAGDFFKKTGNANIDRIPKNAGYETRCTVRIRGLWVDEALDPVTKRIAALGFRKLESHTPKYNTPKSIRIYFNNSQVSGVYQHGRKLFLIIAAESTQKSGRITDLTIGLIE